MYDNGFARAQRSYEAMEPPDNTEDWEVYEERYSTPENNAQLADTLFEAVTQSHGLMTNSVQIVSALRYLLTKGIEYLDIDGRDKLYAFYGIAPSFDEFCESPADDGPDPDIGRDD